MPNKRIALRHGDSEIVVSNGRDAILLLRKQLGLTQQQLADKSSAGRMAISKVERGVINPTVSWIEAVAKSVGYAVELKLFKENGGNQDENK